MQRACPHTRRPRAQRPTILRGAQEQFKLTGEDVKKSSLQAMKDQMAVFKASLEEFAHKYKKSIRQDPAFRAQFHVMCANIGVDPLASNKASGAPRGCACMQRMYSPGLRIGLEHMLYIASIRRFHCNPAWCGPLCPCAMLALRTSMHARMQCKPVDVRHGLDLQ